MTGLSLSPRPLALQEQRGSAGVRGPGPVSVHAVGAARVHAHVGAGHAGGRVAQVSAFHGACALQVWPCSSGLMDECPDLTWRT